ncbi:hypothetical protein EJD97_005274 [Solanum chilense]|uniref:Uncharacterized protein n=1 Tax=Solanum chilense TaxID=4083 RepID=A0A6N2AND9_SOLCI|nr:hypothetical protein EJD97_005274 [Solanum chilense]
MQKRPPTELLTVRRCQRSAAAEGRWGSLTKCRVKKAMTDRCAYDSPSYLSSRVMKRAVEEIAQVWDDGVHDGPS